MASAQSRAPPTEDGVEPKTKKARQQLSLVIQPPVLKFPFVNEYFEVNVYLFDDMNQVKSGDEFEFPLNVRLMLNEQPRTYVENDILEVDPPSPQLGRSGKCTFRVRVRDVSMNYDNRDFVLQVSAVTRVSKYYVAPVISDPMTAIRYRLAIRAESQPPSIWYKDEGGRDKCIEVFVDLVGADGRKVTGQEVPLRVSLVYEDGLPVTKQDILKLSSDSRQVVDPETGTAALRLRIEDVSKNHQSKGFVIKVGPDTQHSPMNSDISPDLSSAISVRSKRNRRAKQGRSDDDVAVPGLSLRGGSVDLALPVSQNPLHDVPAPETVMLDAANPVLKALSSVIGWTRSVVNGLYQIQWQLIGYESKPDGTPDINRPLFNIHNPNHIVTGILQTYRNETMDHLRYLVQATEPGGGGLVVPPHQNGGGAGYNNHSAASSAAFGSSSYANGSAVSMDGGRGGGAAAAAGAYRGGSHDDHHTEPPPLAQAFGGYSSQQQSSFDPMAQDGPAGSATSAAAAGSYGAASAVMANPPNLTYSLSGGTRPPVPPMMRGKSSTLSDALLNQDVNVAMIPLVRESTYDLLAAMDPSWFAVDINDAQPAATSAVESQVHYIMAKVYCSNHFGELGFPAFDQKHTLLGFYREGMNEHSQTVAFYVPLPPNFSDMESKQVVDSFVDELARGQEGGAVACIGSGDLNQLKEKVLTYHWSTGSSQQQQQQPVAEPMA